MPLMAMARFKEEPKRAAVFPNRVAAREREGLGFRLVYRVRDRATNAVSIKMIVDFFIVFTSWVVCPKMK